ncbi:MAG: M1 family metallopeptidase [Deltaproteobacteria bacterium]|nr:M1 family metallopeptidase [Deltaproteobacteria bacterium]
MPKSNAPKRRAGAKSTGAAHRLDPEVRPSAYRLVLDVDPTRGPAYQGEVEIRVRLGAARRRIELHAAELGIGSARVESAKGSAAARVRLDPARQTVTLELARPVGPGEATLRVAFSGRLRGDLRGLYAASAGPHRYAFTQLEAAEARRFFPCFDEPAMKARFTLVVETRAGLATVSNAPIARSEKLPGGRQRVHFAETPKLSTYLVALGVGALERSRAVKLGPTEIRVWHVPGKGGLVGFALEAARATLARLERWFALPYPYAKLDLVAVPDFEAGAMENAGAVFFRENLLLLDAKSATLAEQKRAAEVICHELAHMWYGDLVTMAWWDDLWLNEAFATWMAFAIVDDWKPEWKMWQDFQHHRAAALRLDALAHTHPIHTDVRTPAEATENFDLITYEKGASVVRMLERYLGPATFRKGVRAYIRRHRESNAVAADLWQALAHAAGEPVEPIVRGWIEQAGLPVLSLATVRRNGRTILQLRQERFRARPASRKAASSRAGASAAGQRWPIPWVGRVAGARGRPRLVRKLVRAARDRVDLGPGTPRFVHGNADEGGFFRPLHDAAGTRALARHLPALSAVERMGLVDHQWALARAGRAPLGDLLALVDRLGDEPEADVLTALRGPLAFLEDRLAPALGERAVEAFRDRVAERFGPALAEIGWDPPPREPVTTRVRRGVLVGLLGDVAAWPPVLATAAKRFDAYLARRDALDPNLADAVVALAARTGDATRYEAMFAAFEAAATPQERRRFLLALADFRDPRLVQRSLALCLTPRIPTQDVAIVLARLLANPAARAAAWAFTKQHWARLRRRMPPMLATRLVEATPALGARARADVARFFRAHPLPAGARALEQALERFELDAAFCRLARRDLARWLEG